MCDPVSAVMGIGVAFSAASTIYGGMAQSAGYKAQAKQYQLQREEAKTEASQAQRDRFQEFTDLESANQVAMAASGFTFESFGALTEANRLKALEDMTRIEDQRKVQDGRLKYAKDDARLASRGALVGGIIGGLGSLAQGGANIAYQRGS